MDHETIRNIYQESNQDIIETIKVVRQNTNLGLKEARLLVLEALGKDVHKKREVDRDNYRRNATLLILLLGLVYVIVKIR